MIACAPCPWRYPKSNPNNQQHYPRSAIPVTRENHQPDVFSPLGRYRVPGPGFRVPGFGYRVPGISVLGIGYWILDIAGSGIRFRGARYIIRQCLLLRTRYSLSRVVPFSSAEPDTRNPKPDIGVAISLRAFLTPCLHRSHKSHTSHESHNLIDLTRHLATRYLALAPIPGTLYTVAPTRPDSRTP